jgi:N-acetylglucosamine kinase-like BadF-type ATPase
MGYYLGIDGGGSKTEALMSDENGFIIKAVKGGASNPHFTGREAALDALRHVITMAIEDIDVAVLRKVAVCISGVKTYRSEISEMIGIDKERVAFYTDELNTFIGALAKDYGVIVLAGTGSFAMGKDKDGRECIIGGWGPIIGDPGSGYWIALRALRTAAMEYDGLSGHTALTDKIKEYYGIESINELKRVVSMDNVSPVAALVKEAAQEKDEQAIAIVRETARQLAQMAGAVIDRLKIDDGDYSLALTGGISNFGQLLMPCFVDTIRANYHNINIVEPLFPPAIGAVMLAMKEDGICWDENILNNLKISYRKV